ncbi:MAG: hypothetical protein J6S97_00930 [Bacteroidales bacterium]|nr:hypothetical protein [Bacteroidales bacterium]
MKRSLIFLLFVLLAACQKITPPADGPDGRLSRLPADGFQWTRAEDLASYRSFMRNFGVGYSYDAVKGSYCDWNDIRCQVVNRAELERVQDWIHERLVVTAELPGIRTASMYNYSKRDYIANVELDLKQKVNLGLYHKEKRQRQYFIEDGIEETFYYTLDEDITMVDCYIADASILSLYEYGYESLLTLSFVNAVEHLDESPASQIAPVDSFLNVYGTHVITEAVLGAKIRVDLENYMWMYKDNVKEDSWSGKEFIDAVSGKDQSRKNKDEYKWLEYGHLNIKAWGGDQSTLTGLLGEHRPDGSRTFSTDGIEAWRNSIRYDPDDELHSNVEMVDMRVRPIWEFAEAISPTAAARIKAAVLQDAAMQQELLGNLNFFDASFPIRYKSASCRWHINTNSWNTYTAQDDGSLPFVVNIVSGGRYIASVCHEQIDGKDLWVCYPIYEGRINQMCGLGVDDSGAVFKVQWLGGKALVVREEDETAGDTFYITAGEVGVAPAEGVTYAPSYSVPFIELDGGVQPGGTYDSALCIGFKYGQDFYVLCSGGDSLVGYEEATEFGGRPYFRRKDNYVYIYNPNEIKYD